MRLGALPCIGASLRRHGAVEVVPPDSQVRSLGVYTRGPHGVRIYSVYGANAVVVAVFDEDFTMVAYRLDSWVLTACLIDCGYELNADLMRVRASHTRVG
jgi:hypothetical protein